MLTETALTLTRGMNQLTDTVSGLAGTVNGLAGTVSQLAEAQRHTDERLNALIDVVEKLVSRGNGAG